MSLFLSIVFILCPNLTADRLFISFFLFLSLSFHFHLWIFFFWFDFHKRNCKQNESFVFFLSFFDRNLKADKWQFYPLYFIYARCSVSLCLFLSTPRSIPSSCGFVHTFFCFTISPACCVHIIFSSSFILIIFSFLYINIFPHQRNKSVYVSVIIIIVTVIIIIIIVVIHI